MTLEGNMYYQKQCPLMVSLLESTQSLATNLSPGFHVYYAQSWQPYLLLAY